MASASMIFLFQQQALAEYRGGVGSHRGITVMASSACRRFLLAWPMRALLAIQQRVDLTKPGELYWPIELLTLLLGRM